MYSIHSNYYLGGTLKWAQYGLLLRLHPDRHTSFQLFPSSAKLWLKLAPPPGGFMAEWENVDRIKWENGLINQRLTWLGTFEGLLFVADHYAAHPFLLPLVGLLIAISVDVAICHANSKLTGLDAQAYVDWRRFLMPGTLIPKAIALAWAAILVEKLCYFRESLWCFLETLSGCLRHLL
jgi:hypothetical protein